MVEVFKTNVKDRQQAEFLLDALAGPFPHHKMNFDLEDCDKVLRVEGEPVSYHDIIRIVEARGFHCHVL